MANTFTIAITNLWKSPEEILESRKQMCFCETVDVDMANSICRKCHKLVLCIDLNKYKTTKCPCDQPMINEAFFCERCCGYVADNDGNLRRESRVSVQRVLTRCEELKKEEELSKKKANRDMKKRKHNRY
jgi:hypothetical protein